MILSRLCGDGGIGGGLGDGGWACICRRTGTRQLDWSLGVGGKGQDIHVLSAFIARMVWNDF